MTTTNFHGKSHWFAFHILQFVVPAALIVGACFLVSPKVGEAVIKSIQAIRTLLVV